MCGIFGFFYKNFSSENFERLKSDTKKMMLFAKERGQDSSGLGMFYNGKFDVLKREADPNFLMNDPEFDQFFKNKKVDNSSLVQIGQCRLVTDGSMNIHENNQPVVSENLVAVHNGIIVDNNQNNGAISKESMSYFNDTRRIAEVLNQKIQNTSDVKDTIEKELNEVEGTASMAIFCLSNQTLYLYTNFGSLYYTYNKKNKSMIFASEKIFLENFVSESDIILDKEIYRKNIKQLEKKKILEFECNLTFKKVECHDIYKTKNGLKRCAKCILPESYPFIVFDEKGICNYCLNYKKQVPRGEEKLEEILSKYRSKDGSADCLVGLSGGRDSCYGIHLLKTKYKMNPICYTYDWGLTTDIARINQAKILGKLGIEHLLRAPNLKIKRRYLRKNIDAWLEKPHLGMVPLFMAGDKDFYHYGRQLRKEIDVELTIFCAGQQVEQRPFFVGFCGVDQSLENNTKLYKFSYYSKLKLAIFYMSQYLLNYKYINESLFDSMRSFVTSFLQKDDFLYLYKYIKWDEKEIERTLQREYDWKSDLGYGKNQWRMGDGQTSFTNYIYYKLAGFSEFDEFRSNQVREEMITRKEAIQLAEEDNRPKYETLNYFGHTVGINIEEVLNEINKIPPIY